MPMIRYKNKRKHFVVLLLIAVCTYVTVPCFVHAESYSRAGRGDLPIEKLVDNWKTMQDDQLNRYFDESGGREIATFLYGLTAKERKELYKRDTVLKKETEYTDSSGVSVKMPYYKYLEITYPQVSSFSSYSKTSGYCYFKFKYGGSYVTYKVEFTIDGTYMNKADGSSSIPYSIAVTTTSGSSDTLKNTVKATFTKDSTYKNMQKALTTIAEEGIASTKEYSDSLGQYIYKTKIWQVFVLTLEYNKPAYTYATNEAANTVSTPRSQRFNFRSYNWQNNKATTFDKGVYHNKHREIVTAQVNIKNAGIQTSTDSGAKNATMTVDFNHPTLYIKYHKNKASATGTSPVEGSRPYDDTLRRLKTVTNGCGFACEGYKIDPEVAWKSNGEYWSTQAPGYRADQILDFINGTFFTSKTKNLYANWKLSNHPPEITAPDRVFFLHETVKTGKLIDMISVTDEEDGVIDKNKYTGLTVYRTGSGGTDEEKTEIHFDSDSVLDTSSTSLRYEVKVKYEDSKKAESEKTFGVTVISAPQPEKSRSYPRFINSEMLWTLDPGSIWRLNSEYNSALTDSLERESPIISYEVD